MTTLDLDAVQAPPGREVTFTLWQREWHCRPLRDFPVEPVADLLCAGKMKVRHFFRTVLVAEEVPAFLELLRRPDSPMTIERMERLVAVLVDACLSGKVRS